MAAVVTTRDSPAPTVAASPDRPPVRRRRAWWLVLLAVLPLLTWTAIWLATDRYGLNPEYPRVIGDDPVQMVVDGLERWDSAWYERISEEGYSYFPDRQSTVAFFPSYPMAIRVARAVVADTTIAGIVVTSLSTVAAAVLLFGWAQRRVGRRAAVVTLVVVGVYPYAFFLYGHVYSDALFLLAALGAFVALERDRPLLAGVIGIVATAGRPVGLAVLAGLVVGVLERRGVLAEAVRPWRWPESRWWQSVPGRDVGVLVAAAGFVAYVVYQWIDFGTPVAFVQTQGNEGWAHDPTLDTLLKTDAWNLIRRPTADYIWTTVTLQTLVSLAAIALLVPVWRRFGAAYGTYTALVVLAAVVPSANFIGMGRYLLAAFPLFVLVASWIARRSWLVGVAVAASVPTMLVLASFHSRGYLVS